MIDPTLFANAAAARKTYEEKKAATVTADEAEHQALLVYREAGRQLDAAVAAEVDAVEVSA